MQQRQLSTHHLSLVRNHRDSSGENLRPSDLGSTKAAVKKSADHVDAVVRKGIVIATKIVNKARKEACGAHRLDICLDNLAKLLGYGTGRLAQGERLGRIQIEEDAGEDDSHDHVHLMLREDSTGMLLCLQWEREDVRSEVHVGKVSNTDIRQLDHQENQGSGLTLG